ncbi:MAG: hypothetical protein QGH37_30665 [Candidatus Poribacteria bacterium]|jgi:hypothetical protein|nr:hypothetical protein [Candidatus Poribacteria bacterium]
MKTRERLLFMALGGLLVLVGMIVGQFVFSPVQAQDGAQDATFKTVRCGRLEVGDSLNRSAVIVSSFKGNGLVGVKNKANKVVASLTPSFYGHGSIKTFSSTGESLVTLSGSVDDKTSKVFGANIEIYNIQGARVATIQASRSKDGIIALFDRYGDQGWGKTGRQ